MSNSYIELHTFSTEWVDLNIDIWMYCSSEIIIVTSAVRIDVMGIVYKGDDDRTSYLGTVGSMIQLAQIT